MLVTHSRVFYLCRKQQSATEERERKGEESSGVHHLDTHCAPATFFGICEINCLFVANKFEFKPHVRWGKCVKM